MVANSGSLCVANQHRWLVKQRAAYKAKKLEDWKLVKLEKLKWVPDPFSKQWEENFALLELFVLENGSAYVPQSTRLNGKNIGAWVSSQRIDFKAGKLSSERVLRLQNLKGWKWDATDQAAHSISKSGLSPTKLKTGKI